MPEDATRQFLDRLERDAAVADREAALEGARAVFHALLESGESGDPDDVAALLPEELETLWKPAYYSCLRERRFRSSLDDPAASLPGTPRSPGREAAGAADAAGAAPGDRSGVGEVRIAGRIRSRLPGLSEEDAARLCRAVLCGLDPLLTAERRDALRALVPESLLPS